MSIPRRPEQTTSSHPFIYPQYLTLPVFFKTMKPHCCDVVPASETLLLDANHYLRCLNLTLNVLLTFQYETPIKKMHYIICCCTESLLSLYSTATVVSIPQRIPSEDKDTDISLGSYWRTSEQLLADDGLYCLVFFLFFFPWLSL